MNGQCLKQMEDYAVGEKKLCKKKHQVINNLYTLMKYKKRDKIKWNFNSDFNL